MRDIKFRCWDEHSGMCYFTLKEMWEFDTPPTKNFDDMVWMQYTGLLDKNGVEIYEGDKYQVADNITYEVIYIDKEEMEEYYGCFGLQNKKRNLIMPFDSYALSGGEVIGNIYEDKK